MKIEEIAIGDNLMLWDKDLHKSIKAVVIAKTDKRVRVNVSFQKGKLVKPELLRAPRQDEQ